MAIEHTFNSVQQRNLIEPLAVYFAGKVRKGMQDYRAILFRDDRIMSRVVGSELEIFNQLPRECPAGTVIYAGPSALSCDHGCWHNKKYELGANHGIVNPWGPRKDLSFPDGGSIHVGREWLSYFQQKTDCPNGSNGLSKAQAVERCLHQIRMCDALYAYIDELDCYGTISEIGYAYALGIPIYIVFDDKLKNACDECEDSGGHGEYQVARNDFWFIAEMATQCAWGKPWELIHEIAFSRQKDSKFSKAKRVGIRPKDRVVVLVRDQYTCQMCGVSRADGAVLEIDHIHPVSKGGTNTLSNLQVLCRECNAGKSDHVLPMP